MKKLSKVQIKPIAELLNIEFSKKKDDCIIDIVQGLITKIISSTYNVNTDTMAYCKVISPNHPLTHNNHYLIDLVKKYNEVII